MRQHVDLWYPRNDDPLRTENEPTQIVVGLTDVRAANDIYIDYDFERDGYRIRKATVFEWPITDMFCDPVLVEVAFVSADSLR